MVKSFALAGVALATLALPAVANATGEPRIFQSPTISGDRIAFGYAGDLWIVPRAGGSAIRLTTGVGIENAPVFSPDGSMIAFTGEYDGNIDVFVVSAAGGVPVRLTWHPSPDSAVGWTPDGKSVVFRSNREASSRYAQLYTVPLTGGPAKRLPLPMAYAGQMSPDGAQIAYTPLAPAFGFSYTNFTAWGNYRGGRAGTIWLTTLPGLDSRQVPHADASDFSPVFLGGQVYFLSGRTGRIGVFRFDPASGAVSEVYHNTGADIRSLATDGKTLVFDRLGEIYTLTPGGEPQRVAIEAAGDMPDVRPRIVKVGDEVQTVMPSTTGLRAVVEAHGEILTVPVKKGAVRNITETPGTMERDPAWSPDGQSIAYFSDADGLYALHVAAQTGDQAAGAKAVRKFRLAAEPAYYFKPLWSPDSTRVAFYDNRLNVYVVELATGRVTTVNEPDVYGGFSSETHAMAWSPDSRWLVYPHATANHQHVLTLYSVATGTRTVLTDAMADAQDPAFDRNGKYLYFLASNNAGATLTGLDMTSNLYAVTRSIYALALAGSTPSPVAPESDDEKSVAEARAKAKDDADATPAGQAGDAKKKAKDDPRAAPRPAVVAPTRVDLAGLSVAAIAGRIAVLPLPPRGYSALQTGKAGTLYFLEREAERFQGPPSATLSRWVLETRKKDELTKNVASFALTADGEKMLVASLPADMDAAPAGGDPPKPKYAIVSATTKVKPDADPEERGALDFAGLSVRTDPKAEWAQMYREVWRIQRAYFYDPGFHGYDLAAAEKAYQPYVDGLQSRADLNYVFQEMLTGFSVGHLRGSGGAIPEANKVPGGLLGADYVVRGGRYCFSRIYTGSAWSPQIKAPLGQPGLGLRAGDCILAINGDALTAATDIQQPLEGTAGRAITLRIGTAEGGLPRDVVVVPARSESDLRNLAWIEDNRRTVDRLSGGKLAYVYLPDTGAGGFTAFNRTYFAQTDKQGAVIDERFNAGGQVADYVVEVLGRKIESYWSPRYGQAEHAPGAAIYGPKVMIANEISGSGGDALPWLFKQAKLGPLVGKRTWGGLVGIGDVPVLMDGGQVTSPSVAFFTPEGKWDVENVGVAPDHVVEQDPKAVAAGHDPQLETAVALAMRQLAEQPTVPVKRPSTYPVYR